MTRATNNEAVASFRTFELYGQSALPASDASTTLASELASASAPASQSVVLLHTVPPASSSQHWHFMPQGVGQTSGTTLHVAFGMTWLGFGHCCGSQFGHGSGC